MENIVESIASYIDKKHNICVILKPEKVERRGFLSNYIEVIDKIGTIDDIIWFILEKIKENYPELGDYYLEIRKNLYNHDKDINKRILYSFYEDVDEKKVAALIKTYLLKYKIAYVCYGKSYYHVKIDVKMDKPNIPNIPFPETEEIGLNNKKYKRAKLS